MKKALSLIFLLVLAQVAVLSTVNEEKGSTAPPPGHGPASNENNYPPPPGNDQRYHSNENNYPPPQYNKPSHSGHRSKADAPSGGRDVKMDPKLNTHRRGGIDESVGEREYVTRYRTYNNYNKGYHSSESSTASLLMLLPIGLIVIYISVLIICYSESNQVSHRSFINWLKTNPPQQRGDDAIPTNQFISIEGPLSCIEANSSFSLLEIPPNVIQLKVIEETYHKHEITKKEGNQVTVKTQFIWSSPVEILNKSNEILFCNHKLSKEASRNFTSVCDEYMALPSLSQMSQFMQEHKLTSNFFNSKDGYYYTNDNLATPRLGDKRVKIFYRTITPNTQFAFLGSFNGLLFEPYLTPIRKASLNILLCCFNVFSSSFSICHCAKASFAFEEYIQLEEKANRKSTTIMRITGFVIYVIGNALLMFPLSQLISSIPLIGPQLSSVVMLIGLSISAITFLLIFAIAWFAARPQLSMLIGIVLLIVSMLVSAKISTIRINERNTSISFIEAIKRTVNYYSNK